MGADNALKILTKISFDQIKLTPYFVMRANFTGIKFNYG